jgi:membrane protein
MGAHHVSVVTDESELEDDAAADARLTAVIGRLPAWMQRSIAWLLSRWPGRIAIHGVKRFLRLDMFDRSMTIAAQFFTSVFPILILFITWAASRESDRLADALNLPEETRSILEDATQGAGSASFGIIGTLIVLAAATSLSRALTRCFAAIWDIRGPKSGLGLGLAWRWLAVVLVLALSLVVVSAATEPVDVTPLRELLPLLASFGIEAGVALFVPWVLLAGAVPWRRLAPGALLFALLMLSVRPATAAWLPHALEVSADRYGPIGVAFTYLACLYTAAFCFLSTAVLGQVIATDEGKLGELIRGTEPAGEAQGTSEAPATAPGEAASVG